MASGDDLFAAPYVAVEFTSALQKLRRRGLLQPAEAAASLSGFFALSMASVESRSALTQGFDLAETLRHSDTFDTTGYALAQELGAEFWVCDQRFANSAAALGFEGVRLFD